MAHGQLLHANNGLGRLYLQKIRDQTACVFNNWVLSFMFYMLSHSFWGPHNILELLYNSNWT